MSDDVYIRLTKVLDTLPSGFPATESGIEIKILGDVKPIEQWAVMGELRLRLKRAFDAEGIEIPWPHTKVYFGNTLKDS